MSSMSGSSEPDREPQRCAPLAQPSVGASLLASSPLASSSLGPVFHVSGRATPEGASLNQLSRTRLELEATGVSITDLTSTNPTMHGLFDTELLDIVACATRQANHYDPTPRGPITSREALAARFGGTCDDYWLTVSTSEAYNWLFTLLTDPSDTVAIPAPGYPLIEPLARLASIETREYRAHYLPRWGWEYDFDTVSQALALPTTKALVAVNPNNPTGAYLDGDAADRIASLCARNRAALIADEVFFPFQLRGTVSGHSRLGDTVTGPAQLRDTVAGPARLAGRDDCLTFALDGLSKLLAAPQLKLGWIRLSGPPDGRREAAAALDMIADAYLAVSQPVALALPALLERADASISRICERINTNYNYLTSCFTDDGFGVRAAQGGWMALLDVPTMSVDEDPTLRDLGLADTALADPALVALRKTHLYVHPGWFYDLDSANTLAISLLPEPATFRDNLQRLKVALQEG